MTDDTARRCEQNERKLAIMEQNIADINKALWGRNGQVGLFEQLRTLKRNQWILVAAVAFLPQVGTKLVALMARVL